MSEREIARALAAREGGECEVKTPVGYIDVLTPKKLYEVKAVRGWKGALGQVLSYGRSFPDRKLCLYLYGEATAAQKRLIREGCKALGVAVEWHREPKADEPPPPLKEVTPVADGMKLSLAAVDQYNHRGSFRVNLLTPTRPITPERLDAYMDEALSLFDVLLDNTLTLTLAYAFGGEQRLVVRTREARRGAPVSLRLNLTLKTTHWKAQFQTSLPGFRSSLPSGHQLDWRIDYCATQHVPEINQLRAFILHPEFRWTSRYQDPATRIESALWEHGTR
ncbi:MAG TPA: hypothetical protein VFS21_01095 [Roseiflexaceae bacterium]|nr:hypothetical protein [Roseiflexaceae bacterium]